MRVLLIVDAVFALREAALLSRLQVSLAADGARVLLALPERVRSIEGIEVLGDPVPYRGLGTMLTRGVRARGLIRRLPSVDGQQRQADVVHVFGGAAWALGAEVASLLGAPVALEVWRAGLCDRARAFRAQGGSPVLFLAPDRAIERRLLSEGSGVSVRLARWGGNVPPEPAPVFRAGRDLSLMIAGNGRDAEAFLAAFEGAARVVAERPGTMLFADADGARRVGLWKRARYLGVLNRLTLVDRLEQRRDQILMGDVFIHPERLHEHRTVLLDAMGAGMPIVAGTDDDIESLIDGRTAMLVKRPEPDAWHQALSGLINDPEGARALGASAREFIRDGRKFTGYAAAVQDAYEWMTSAGTIPFERTPSVVR